MNTKTKSKMQFQKQKENESQHYRQNLSQKERGITLVALVVTIVVLLILSGITITALFGDNGIIKSAQKAKTETERDVGDTENGLKNLVGQLNDALGIEKEYDITADAAVVTKIAEKTIKVKDSTGKNIITLPKGFRIKTREGTSEMTSVKDGIVITDSINDTVQGNEFVWIPVGKVYKSNNEEDFVDIKLGRYTFNTSSPGKPTLAEGTYQYAYTEENPKNYEGTVTNIKDGGGVYACHELVTREDTTKNDGVASSGRDGLNAIAKDLGEFVTSVNDNGGYYLARYEASYGSGYNKDGSNDTAKYENAKPLSQPSGGKSDSSMSYTEGTLWNFITQINASKVCKNMYKENKDINGNTVGVESDLVNSYAWDTAIVYIQEMGNADYANKKDGSGTLRNTGETNTSTSKPKDEVCKINDMGSNLREWTTEYSTYMSSSGAEPCVCRGGSYGNAMNYTAGRYSYSATTSGKNLGFRPLLYIK